MAVLSSMVCSLSTYYPEEQDIEDKAAMDMTIARLISKVRTIAAYAYKRSIGQPFIYPRNDLKYCANFLNMMFSVPAEPYYVDPEVEAAINLLFILHADHEQNCSTASVRLRSVAPSSTRTVAVHCRRHRSRCTARSTVAPNEAVHRACSSRSAP